MPTCVAVAGGGRGARMCGSGRRCGGGAHVCGSGSGRRWWWCPRVLRWQTVVVVPTCVAVADGGGGAHVCGSGGRRWWCPRVWQWQQAVVLVPTCVAVAGGVVLVPTCVAVEGGGGDAHVCGSGMRWWWCPCVAVECGGGGAHMCVSDRRCGVVPRVWQWKAVVLMCGSGRRCGSEAHVCGLRWCPRSVAVEGGGGGAHVCGSGRRWLWCPRVWQ